MTTKTTTPWTRATMFEPATLRPVITSEQGDREGLDRDRVAAGERRAGIAPEGQGDHRRHDAVGDVHEPGHDRRDVAVAEPAVDVLEQAAGRWVARPELAERVALQGGDATGQQERQPDGRPGDLAGRAEQREDPGADHRGDADGRGLAGADVLAGGARPRSSGCAPTIRIAAGRRRRARRAPASPRANAISPMMAATTRMATTQRSGPSMPAASLRSGRARPGRSCSARRPDPCRARSRRS